MARFGNTQLPAQLFQSISYTEHSQIVDIPGS